MGKTGLHLYVPIARTLDYESVRAVAETMARQIERAHHSSLTALARSTQAAKPLVIRGIDPITGAVQNLGIELPPGVGGSAAVAARWDLARRCVLILARREGTSAGAFDYWLGQMQGGP